MKKEKYEIEGQLSIFDIVAAVPEEHKVTEIYQILEYDLLKGTGFRDGKKRVYEFFKAEENKNKRIEFLKKEYGIGGGSGVCEGIGYMQNHNANGIDIKPDKMLGKTKELHSGWMMIERHIDKLIIAGKYYEEAVCKYSSHSCNKQELWKIAETLDDPFCPHVCCRHCATKNCGARCNGSEEPKTITCKTCFYEDNGICGCWSSKCEYSNGPCPDKTCSWYDGISEEKG